VKQQNHRNDRFYFNVTELRSSASNHQTLQQKQTTTQTLHIRIYKSSLTINSMDI